MLLLLLSLLICGTDAQVSVTVSGGPLINEADVTVTISVALSGRPEDDNTTYVVRVSTEDTTAKAGQDFGELSQELLFTPDSNTQDVFLRIFDDNAVEDPEFFNIITNSSFGTTSDFVIIQDDRDRVSAAFQERNYTAVENSSAIVCVDIIEGTVERSVDFSISFSSLTASPVDDYSTTGLNQTMTFDRNTSTVCVSLLILLDSLVEDTETFVIFLTGSSDVVIGSPSSSTVSIIDSNGGVVGVVNPTEPEISPLFIVTESNMDQNISFCVELISGDPLQRALPVQVEITMQSGTARDFLDFVPVSGLILEFPPNSVNGARVCSDLTIVGDVFSERTEFFHIVVAPLNPADKADNIGTVFIANDDQLIRCPDLPSPDNGEVTVSILSIGDSDYVQIANYSCESGYNLNTVQFERVCLASGNWSGFEPMCNPVNCGNLSDPILGEVSTDGTVFGSQANYSCTEGFVVSGNTSRECQSDGEWSGETPNCVPAVCDTLADPVNGTVLEVRFFGLQSVAVYFCDNGFDLTGETPRRCQSNETWSGDAPICEIVDCGALDDPPNGQVTTHNNTVFRSVAVYSCSEGYIESGGDQLRNCQASGEWSGEPLTCSGVDCGMPPLPPNGQRIVYGTTFNTGFVSYACNEGYTLLGSANQTCDSNGRWSASVPQCNPIQCVALDSPVNGLVVTALPPQFPTHARYTCNSGYMLMGNSTRDCLENRQWSGVEPTCEVQNCGALQDPENGWVFLNSTTVGSSAEYRCNSGYQLSIGAPSTRLCLTNGQWTNTTPTCEQIQCGDLRVPPGVSVVLNGTIYGSKVMYTCDNGLILVSGSSVRTCEADGQWSGSEPQCQSRAPPIVGGNSGNDGEGSSTTLTVIVVSVSLVGFTLAVIITTIIILVAVRRFRKKASYAFDGNTRTRAQVYEVHPNISAVPAYGENGPYTEDSLPMGFTVVENTMAGQLNQTFDSRYSDIETSTTFL